MALNLEQKKYIVAEVADVVSNALSIVAADYSGLSSPQMTELRAKARQVGVKLRIIRNTLIRRAFLNTPYKCMLTVFRGPVLLAIAHEDPSSSARLLRDFAKINNALEIKALSLGNTLLSAKQIEAVANLLTREEALTKLAWVLQVLVSKFVRTLARPQAKFVLTLAAMRDKQQTKAS